MGFLGSVLWFLSGKEVWQKNENVAKNWQEIRAWIAKYMRKISDFSLKKIVKCSFLSCSFAIHFYCIGRYSIKFKTQISFMSIYPSVCISTCICLQKHQRVSGIWLLFSCIKLSQQKTLKDIKWWVSWVKCPTQTTNKLFLRVAVQISSSPSSALFSYKATLIKLN